MHVGFLPFIPKPVTEYSTIYTSMLNFVNVSNGLVQEALPLFCDEGPFRIANIYLQIKDGFLNIIPMLRDFHTAKYVEHCIGKYIQGSYIEERLRQAHVIAVNVGVKNYSRVPYFSQCNRKVKMGDLFETYSQKNPEESKSSYQCQVIKEGFETFPRSVPRD